MQNMPPNKEWLLTDGFGSYAMGCESGIPRRRYHCYLCVPGPRGSGRYVLLTHTEEVLLWEGKQLKVFPDFEGHQGNESF